MLCLKKRVSALKIIQVYLKCITSLFIQAIEGIEIVCIAVEAYSPSPTCLTAIHSDLIQVRTYVRMYVRVKTGSQYYYDDAISP